jgi:GNAT superfamily N-acetyltransferase
VNGAGRDRDFGPLLAALRRLDGFDVRLGGGWGVDVLAGQVTRFHHDIDVFVPVAVLDAAADRFIHDGFEVVMASPHSRTVLESGDGRRIDLNGVSYRPDGHAVQTDDEGDVELFPSWVWTERLIAGQPVVCLTAEGQRFKHRGYQERPADRADLALLGGQDGAFFDPTVRPLEVGEEDLVPLVEAGSERLFEATGIWPLPPASPAAIAAIEQRTRATLVAGRPPVGIARLEVVDGHAHLGQVSVLPEYGRLGIGTDLVEASIEWARDNGYDVLTLTTFADVPFNARWYQRLGFRCVPDHEALGPQLAGIVDQERDLEPLGTRVVMSISTSPEQESDDHVT